jgi:hypothetical protein
MLRWPLRCSRDGISLDYHAFVTFVILQNGIRLCCQRVTIMSVRINVHRDHVRPHLEVFLALRREFMLMIHRPAVQITGAPENERGFGWSCTGARLLRVEQVARNSY